MKVKRLSAGQYEIRTEKHAVKAAPTVVAKTVEVAA